MTQGMKNDSLCKCNLELLTRKEKTRAAMEMLSSLMGTKICLVLQVEVSKFVR